MKKQNNYYVETREIDVKRMLVHTLTYWRWILIIALAGALILGVTQYRKDVTAAKNSIQAQIDAANTPVPTVDSLSAQLTADQVQNVWNAVNFKAYADSRTAYMNESVYMNLDPYNEDVVYLNYEIYSDNPAYVLSQLSNYIGSEELAEKISKDMGLTIANKYVMELYTITYSDNISRFTVKVCADDAEECDKLSDSFDRIVTEYVSEPGKTEDEAKNSLVLTERTADVAIDANLQNLQASYNSEIYNNTNTYGALYGGFNDVQKALFQLLTEQKENTTSSIYDAGADEQEVVLSGDASAIDTTVHVNVSIKMIITGFLAGAIIAYAIFALGYTISKAIHGVDEVKYLFAVPVFGNIRMAAFTKKRKGEAVDTAIDKLNYGRKKYLNSAQQMQMVYSNLLLSCKNKNVSEVYLTGTELERIPQSCISELVSRLKAQQITVTVGNSILYDAESLMKMAACGHAVFVEIENVSKCEEIAKELNLCIQNHIEVMGIIMTQK